MKCFAQIIIALFQLLLQQSAFAAEPKHTTLVVPARAPISVLRITSLAVANEFYGDFLGFKFDWGNDEPQAGHAYVQVSRPSAGSTTRPRAGTDVHV
jgi:hypothetical protein